VSEVLPHAAQRFVLKLNGESDWQTRRVFKVRWYLTIKWNVPLAISFTQCCCLEANCHLPARLCSHERLCCVFLRSAWTLPRPAWLEVPSWNSWKLFAMRYKCYRLPHAAIRPCCNMPYTLYYSSSLSSCLCTSQRLLPNAQCAMDP
jgi:hypothetical protein